MQRLLILAALFWMAASNSLVAQPASTAEITMHTFMAKNPGGNATPANISMWPNPARGSVNIYINSIKPGDRGECVFYNSAGRAAFITNLQNGNNKIFFNSLPEGLYLLNIKLRDGIVFSKKLVVSR